MGRTEGQRGDGDYVQTAVPEDTGGSPGGLTGQYGYIIK
jgi:hypothetical protein